MRCWSPDGWAGLLRLWSFDLTLPFKITVAGERGLQASWSDHRPEQGAGVLVTGLGTLGGGFANSVTWPRVAVKQSLHDSPWRVYSASISRWSQMFLVLCLITMSHASPCYPWEAHSPEGSRLDHKGRRLSHILVLWAPRALCTYLYFSCCCWVWAVIFLWHCVFPIWRQARQKKIKA